MRPRDRSVPGARSRDQPRRYTPAAPGFRFLLQFEFDRESPTIGSYCIIRRGREQAPNPESPVPSP
jgi:hypothetical protein